MQHDVLLTVLPGEDPGAERLAGIAAREIGCAPAEITAVVCRKRSVDARRRQVKIRLSCTAYLGEAPPETGAEAPGGVPQWKRADPRKRVVIVGAGPAGLFAAFRLLEDGITPVIVERGKRTDRRARDILRIADGVVDGDSNYCFGEGGAGAFSDGKLYTRAGKRGSVGKVLRIFRRFGADEAILTDARPHIGSDRLPGIVRAMTDAIRSLGGEIHFETRCTGLLLGGADGSADRQPEYDGVAEYGDNAGYGGGTESGGSAEQGGESALGRRAVEGVRVTRLADGSSAEIRGDAVLLAPGHSAPDTYRFVQAAAPDALVAKTFAVGVRVEHPRALIDAIQYHGGQGGLSGAEYRLATEVGRRGVYSFCMCPGGVVVPSASSSGEIVLNGMSPSGRDTAWSSAAFVVETRPEDVPSEFSDGLAFRAHIERLAKAQGSGQRAPAQRLTDFLTGRDSAFLPPSSYPAGVVPSRLDRWLPENLVSRLKTAFAEFDRKMRGFVCDDALVLAPETRSSSPLRIARDGETGECPFLPRLFPAGEGAGYAGGIVSSALDGEKAAERAARFCGG
jgi:uncharacterized FAD-dependent dehydrogenase